VQSALLSRSVFDIADFCSHPWGERSAEIAEQLRMGERAMEIKLLSENDGD
jgi:hypothetical protein